MRVYAKRGRDFVLIKAERNYLIAPEKPDEFIKNLMEKIEQNTDFQSLSKKFNRTLNN